MIVLTYYSHQHTGGVRATWRQYARGRSRPGADVACMKFVRFESPTPNLGGAHIGVFGLGTADP